MDVTCCVCHQCSFLAIAHAAKIHGWTTVEDITAATRAGSRCGACLPYLADVLRTGRTRFPVRPPPSSPRAYP